MDFHCDGKVNYSEFLAATISSIHFNKEEKLWSAFNYFDTTDSGFITLDSIIDALKEIGVMVDEEGLQKTFKEMKKQGKKINFDEFRNIAFKSFEDDLKERTESKKSIEFEVIREDNEEHQKEDENKDENENKDEEENRDEDEGDDKNENEDKNKNEEKDRNNNDNNNENKEENNKDNNGNHEKEDEILNEFNEKNNNGNGSINVKNSKIEEGDK